MGKSVDWSASVLACRKHVLAADRKERLRSSQMKGRHTV